MNNQLKHLLNISTEIDTAAFNGVTNCLVIAPHPDDESLGCGALIANLRDLAIGVYVIFTTDGSMSHPHSRNTSSAARCKMREQEAVNALGILGVEESRITFLRGKDSALPALGEKGFQGFVAQMVGIIDQVQPELVLVPYEFDPHRDHRASWQITVAALEKYPRTELWQYLIWLYTLGDASDVEPITNIPGGIQYLTVGKQKDKKKIAIAQHKSQLSHDLFDDPEGFILLDDVLQNFYGDKEYYIKQAK
jgi:LmbE family N-acetylglucosaminyl deacetylase